MVSMCIRAYVAALTSDLCMHCYATTRKKTVPAAVINMWSSEHLNALVVALPVAVV